MRVGSWRKVGFLEKTLIPYFHFICNRLHPTWYPVARRVLISKLKHEYIAIPGEFRGIQQDFCSCNLNQMYQHTPVPREYGLSTFIIEIMVQLKQGKFLKTKFFSLYVWRCRMGTFLGDRIEYLRGRGWEFNSHKNNQLWWELSSLLCAHIVLSLNLR